MAQADNPALANSQSQSVNTQAYDVIVVGGGVIGAWTAYKAGKNGLKTLLIEAQKMSAGASGGLLGALMPHMPERWDGKKQFQFEALEDLPQEVALLESETGIDCGFNRCGRLAPIMNETKRGQMQGHGTNVDAFWHGRYQWQIIDQPFEKHWPVESKASCGLVYDTLSARINPRGLVNALRQAILKDENVAVIEGVGLKKYNADKKQAFLSNNETVSFSHIVLAAGPQTFDFIAPELNVASLALGKPIKGQAAMLSADIDPNWPIVFDNGIYVISHGAGRVAVGSTSELEFSNPFTTDEKIDDVIARAKALCPLIKDAPVIEKWAGLRPRAAGRDPLIDVMPDHQNVIVSTSGFKITFGVAHKMADVAIENILGKVETIVPDSFKIAAHLAKARRAEKQDNLS
ncbi:MAG: FAD-dependent oxidoreductase [Lentilitoribacter sp.]